MGKLKIIGISIVVVFLSTVIFRSFFSDKDKAIYQLYMHLDSESNFKLLHKCLGIVPKCFKQQYEISSIEGNDVATVYCISTDKKSIVPISYVFIEVEGKQTYIKGDPIFWSKNDDIINYKIPYENHISYAINIDGFNKYIDAFEINRKDDIIEKYLYFISFVEVFPTYKIISSQKDIDTIIYQYPLRINDMPFLFRNEKIYNSDFSLNFDDIEHNENDIVYCWLYRKGIVKFHFSFNKNRVINVESEILGVFGNEDLMTTWWQF